jgi:hypothetical protein
MSELKELHDKAIGAALNAAYAVAEDEFWFLGGAEPTKKAAKAWEMKRGAWLHFARENHLAPAEALWIKGGALGLHDGKTAFADLPALIRLAFETFRQVFLMVSDALDEQARIEAARIAAEERAAELAARPPVKPDYEGTPLEQHEDPLAPSEFARAPAKAATDGTAS